MEKIAVIRGDDRVDGEEIVLGIEEGKVVASNGDDVSYYKVQTDDECRSDILAQWGRWNTFSLSKEEENES